MPISAINPVVDRPGRKDTDFHASPDSIGFVIIRIVARERPQFVEQSKKSLPLRFWHPVHDLDYFQVDKKPILHQEGLLFVFFLELI